MPAAVSRVRANAARWLRIGVALTLAELTLHNLYQVISWVSRSLGENDFRLYYAAAEIGLRHGWPHVYDAGLQRATVAAVWPDPSARFFPFVSPPPMAWLAVPFTALPAPTAYVAWTSLTLVLLVAAALLAAGAGVDRLARVTYVLSGLGFLASFVALVYGQPAPLLVLAVIAAWRLLERGQDVAAGAVLAILVLKPQDGLLVAPLLIVAGRWRATATWAVVAAALAIASVVALGLDGTRAYLAALSPFANNPYFQRWSLGAIAGDGAAWYLSAVGVVALAGAVTWFVRRDTAAVLAVGVAASLLAARYLTLSDLVLLLAPVWLLANAAPAWQRPFVGLLWLMGWFMPAVAVLMFVAVPLIAGLALTRRLSLPFAGAAPIGAPALSLETETPAPVP
jgi:hypothetical protein